MSYKKVLKILILNLTLLLINIILFSPGLLAMSILGVSVLQTAFTLTVIFMSIIIFLVGNYKLINVEAPTIIEATTIDSIEECEEVLRTRLYKNTFMSDIDTILSQLERFNKKKTRIKEILLQKFEITELTYLKFKSTLESIENIIYINTKSIVNKINIFDENEYRLISKKHGSKTFSNELINQKMNIYKEYITYVKEAITDNEEILLKLDKLLLELSNFNSLEIGELENMEAIKEIDDLISKIKLYK